MIQNAFEGQTIESLLPEWEDQQPTHEESVKGHDTLETTTSPLPSSLDPTPASRDERFSGPKRGQLAAPWAHAEGPDRRSTSVVEPLQDRAPPHLELFVAQLAVPVRCAMQSCLSILPFWSRSVWCLRFCVMHLLLHFCEHAIPALSAGAIGTTFSALSYNTVIIPPVCGAPSVGVSSPGDGTRVHARPLLSSWGYRCILIIHGGGSTNAPGRRQSSPSPTRPRGLPIGTCGGLQKY